jgi:hypothetical protein
LNSAAGQAKCASAPRTLSPRKIGAGFWRDPNLGGCRAGAERAGHLPRWRRGARQIHKRLFLRLNQPLQYLVTGSPPSRHGCRYRDYRTRCRHRSNRGNKGVFLVCTLSNEPRPRTEIAAIQVHDPERHRWPWRLALAYGFVPIGGTGAADSSAVCWLQAISQCPSRCTKTRSL